MIALKAALRRIADDLPLRQNLSAAARRTSAKHDARLVRPAFQNILRNAAENIRAETSNAS
jgi:nitrogen fixation/metabolism regulation signal transduction histidine kinase